MRTHSYICAASRTPVFAFVCIERSRIGAMATVQWAPVPSPSHSSPLSSLQTSHFRLHTDPRGAHGPVCIACPFGFDTTPINVCRYRYHCQGYFFLHDPQSPRYKASYVDSLPSVSFHKYLGFSSANLNTGAGFVPHERPPSAFPAPLSVHMRLYRRQCFPLYLPSAAELPTCIPAPRSGLTA